MVRKPRPERVAPGLMRVPAGNAGLAVVAPGRIPLTLTTDAPADALPLGLLTPTAQPPWGCLFFSILGGSFLLSLLSRNWAVVLGVLALIVFWGFYNHPRRSAAAQVKRALGMLAVRKGRRARQALERPLARLPEDEGLNYVAAIVNLADERWSRAREHFELAAPRFSAYAEYHHLLGRCLAAIGEADAAGAALRRALEFPAYPGRQAVIEDLADPAAGGTGPGGEFN